MVDDPQQPPKKVVKRVVKKTVSRPAPASPPQSVRYGRSVSTKPKPQAKVATRAGASTATTVKAAKPSRPRVEVGAKVGAAGRAVGSRASVAAGLAGSAGRTSGTFVADRTRTVLAWRIPHIEPRLASIITGAVVGLVSIGFALLALEIFTQVRGVASGGGRWGSLTFVVVAFGAFFLGNLLLSAFGTAQPGLISFLGVVLAIVAILALFLGLAETQWAFLLVPTLGALTYATSNWLITLADSSPTLPE
ncbi:hypothetical protein C6I20_14460 [Aeromicrobium sp. A1-2]|uniref:hypothetical protein n=1 Tax=Aeromicrobium sp. A1-2 TaxID=2107713 RepID=UPI000E4BFD09|nr:hypothetical protein [Aeromicrobium sp. A1-2]AXT86264.1 hypothetical protein C6I20_14460 [Aeromicrobium sp. A1-2]